jgi:hydrogenase-4 component B
VTFPDMLVYAAPGFPILLTVLMLMPAVRPALFRLLPFAPLPALAASIFGAGGVEARLRVFLLGAEIGPSEMASIFLGVSALLWILAGIYAQRAIAAPGRVRFAGFWLATLSGNMLLFTVADVVSFYLAFAILSLSAFGLVVHHNTLEARRAARIYLVLAVLGETFILLGLLIGAQGAGTLMIPDVREAIAQAPLRDLAIGLLVAGFGIKAGLIPLHVWLPLAHPAAPVPASAVLSGAIVKAGIFGLATFLPLETDLPHWSAALVILGLTTAYCGIIFGVVQPRLKTVLAYSTLSQMGLVIVVLGSGFGSQGPGLVLAAVTLYAAHHSLTKGSLFLSVGVMTASDGRSRGPVILLAALAAFAIAGLPFTGGALAKLAIKGPLGDEAAAFLVTLSAVGTTLLMLRFVQLFRALEPAESAPPAALFLPFAGCVAAALSIPWLLFPDLTNLTLGYAIAPEHLWGALWPILAGAAVMAALLHLPAWSRIRIPEGDIVVLFEAGWRRTAATVSRIGTGARPRLRPPRVPQSLLDGIQAVEQKLARWPNAGALLLLAVVLFAGSLL